MKRTSRLGNLAAMALAAAAISPLAFVTTYPPAYAAYCKQWIFNGTYFFGQSNNLTLVFSGFNRTPSGTAALLRAGIFTAMRGPITGRLDGNNIFLQVKWDNGTVGTYQGKVDGNGHASGTYNSTDPSSNTNWSTSGEFLCIASN